MRKTFQNQTEIYVSEMLISLQMCDKNEARDGGAEGMQQTLENLAQIDTYVSKLSRRKHCMSFGIYICNI